jgi:Notch-like protein
LTDYQCECQTGYVGKDCEIRACTKGSCNGHGTCINNTDGNGYNCQCDPPYFGSNCADTSTACDGKTCNNVGMCSVISLVDYQCQCDIGYTGKDCEYKACTEDSCSGHGNCTNNTLSNGYNCQCDLPYFGSDCEKESVVCDNVTCSYNGNCSVKSMTDYECLCEPGYGGKDCDKERCTEASCNGNGNCTDDDNGFICVCIPPFYGTNCLHGPSPCEDKTCNEVGVCVNSSLTDYHCQCDDGFFGKDCEKINGTCNDMHLKRNKCE